MAKFVLFTILSTPPNVLWQEFLEDVFPGEKKVQPAESSAIKKGANDEKQGKDVVKDKAQQKSAGMNWANVLWKFLLDQTVGGIVNTVLFIAGMKALNGGNAEEVKVAVKEVSSHSDCVLEDLCLEGLRDVQVEGGKSMADYFCGCRGSGLSSSRAPSCGLWSPPLVSP